MPMRAYPRSRGGTYLRLVLPVLRLGLSPLARGNPGGGVFSDMEDGPIPARAGEPFWSFENEIEIWAYPRSRGGTILRPVIDTLLWGLSPLARGNLGENADNVGADGPIPARAGEPWPARPSSHRPRAYPRSRGGTGVRVALGAWG